MGIRWHLPTTMGARQEGWRSGHRGCWINCARGCVGSDCRCGRKKPTRMGAAFHPRQRQAASARHGRRRGRGVSHASRRRGASRAPARRTRRCRRCCFCTARCSGVELPWLMNRAREAAAAGAGVLTRDEVRRAAGAIEGAHWLMASLLYGTGMRLMECLRLRVKDVDFERSEITVRDGKGGKDRRHDVAATAGRAVAAQLARGAGAARSATCSAGYGEVRLPHALARKYPNAAREWAWQYVFPVAASLSAIRARRERRHHLDESVPAARGEAARARARASPSRRAATRCAIRSPRTCSRPATTSAPCRNCSATRTWRPRRSTRTCSTAAAAACCSPLDRR